MCYKKVVLRVSKHYLFMLLMTRMFLLFLSGINHVFVCQQKHHHIHCVLMYISFACLQGMCIVRM